MGDVDVSARSRFHQAAVENVEHSGETADVGRSAKREAGTSPVHRRNSNATM